MKNEVNIIFSSKFEQIYDLCEKLDIEELFFFGSSINGKFISEKSDLDILVNTSYNNKKSVVRLSIELRKMFNCSVDVFHKHWYKHPELEEHLKLNKVLIYKKNTNN